MKKNWIVTSLITVLSLSLLAGCGHEHHWSEASCTAPAACSDCGETQGEALEHEWLAASCTEPATCSVCGETQGEALAHQLSKANYQTPATCSVCGSSQGDVLTPDFVTYGIHADMEEGVVYAYNTVSNDGSQKTVGQTTISSYEIIDSDDLRQAREGYEWHVVTFTTVFDDAVARQNGASVDYTISDYYDIARFSDNADHSDSSISAYTVNIDGEDSLVYMGQSGSFSGNADGSFTFTFTISVQIPIDYDGIVVGLNNASIDTRHGAHLNEVYNENEFLLFRLNG